MTTKKDARAGKRPHLSELPGLFHGLFDTAFDELPAPSRNEVALLLPSNPRHWDALTPEQREALVLPSEPGAEFGRAWGLYAEIAKWWRAEVRTATDMAIQEERIAALRKRIEETYQAPARKAPGGAATRQRQRGSPILLDIEAALAECGRDATPNEIMACLKRFAGKPGSLVKQVVVEDGKLLMRWQHPSGDIKTMTKNALLKRLANIRRRFEPPSRPPLSR